MKASPLIGVIAGTHIDTQMGYDFLARQGYTVESYALARTAEEQNALQVHEPEKLFTLTYNQCRAWEKSGYTHIVLYCNSLSSVLNIAKLRQDISIPIITPFDAYTRWAKQYNHVTCLAANPSGITGVERIFLREKPHIGFFGCGYLEVVNLIEVSTPPETIIEQTGVHFLLDIAHQNKTELFLLGCTHFPCLTAVLRARAQEKNYTFDIKDIDEGLLDFLPRK